ncbi:hypothetical protein CBR_g50212 [Chara braunii]|uniref:Integrase catalytic domain-containing protein n=1 Tax=Chara braunii TaxID=69332 RepID=A0A388M6K6_CHABU|nr:hypothetical protein CBR_g50212 [Chara braunii]|eukprot:GBG90119.1 hypothetical protein CBR_g50212 [Chara braunii]
MPTSSTGTSSSSGSRQSSSQMVGSQFSPLTLRERELWELQQVERTRERLERELKPATDRDKEIKNRTARLDTLEADKAELEGLDDSGMNEPMKVLRNNMLSLHAHMDSRLDFMQNTLDQILDVLTRPGFRPPAQSPLPLTAMSGPFPVQAGTQLSGTSAAVAQTVASSSSGPAVGATSPQQPVQQSGQPQGQWYPKTPMKPPLAFSDERKDEELNTWLSDQFLLITFVRCFPENIRNLLASEARVEYHSFETLSRKALDLEAMLGNAQPTSQNDSKKKKSPQEWKKKGAKLMMVESDGTQTEIDELSALVDYSEYDGEEVAEGSTLAAVVKAKAGGRGKGQPRSPGKAASNQTKQAEWVKAGLDQDVWRDRRVRVVEREVVHAIEIIPGSKTPKGMIYRMAPAELDELRRQLKELTEKGWIRVSTSPYGSPVLFVPKKRGTLRMCIDYRGLNAITVKNAEPLPRIDDLLDRVQGCKYYSKIDLKSGYHQMAIRPEDQHKTTFQTRYDLYEFVVMPFGLCNAPGTFQRAMNRIFHDHLDKFVVVYLDDILIFSKSAEEHAQHVETVLSLLRQHKYKVDLEKCEFGRTKILYLSHEVSAEGIRPKDAKVASIRDWPRPQTVTEVRSFLGMCGYYRNFVKNYFTIASPLTDLTRLDTPWDWSDECEGALMNHEVLMVPDPQKPFIVTTDASQYGIGAMLAQQDGKKLRLIEYMSKKMPSKKLAKSTYERELYALYKALVHWRHFLLGRFFYLRTDHQTLKWIKTQPTLSDALKRWIEVIDQYDFKLEYLKGEYNKVADALSRRADYLGALVSNFGISDEVTQSLVGVYQEDPVTMDIIHKLHAKDKATESEFVMVDGLLYLDKAGIKRLVVPSSEPLRSLFLGECHDATGHFGYKKTSVNLVQRFWWPGMFDDAKKYVETCQICQRDKPRSQAPLGLLKPLPIPPGPGQSVSMDFMDTLVTSKSGKRHIFIIINRFTKYARLVAMPESARSDHVIKLFKDNWVRDFGLPKTIVSDRDVRFTSELWKKTAEQMGSQLQMTSGNHPEASGQAEQMNRVVQHLLRHYIKPNQDDWDEKLPLIASLYNNAVHSSTGRLAPSS